MQANRSARAHRPPVNRTADEDAGAVVVGPADSARPVDPVDAVLAASRALVAVSARSIAGVEPVTLPQYRMLVVLDAGPTNLSALAEALDVAPSTATRMVDRLVSLGLVERTIPPDNRREVRLSTTREGATTVAEVTSRRRRDIAAVLEHLSTEGQLAVAGAMAAFADAATSAWGAPASAPL